MSPVSSLRTINERIIFAQNNKVWKSQYSSFLKIITNLKNISTKPSQALSVSCGDGMWDYVTLKNTKINKIIATDIVDCPVIKDDIKLLNSLGKWTFKKVKPDTLLPFKDNTFDLIIHQDVVEHTYKPIQF